MTPRAMARIAAGLCLTAFVVSAGDGLLAQRGGGRGGARGGAAAPAVDLRSRLEILTDVFHLERDARNAVRATLDAAHKEAAPIRVALATTRAALAEAVATGASDDARAAAARAYAEASTKMTEHEIKAFVKMREHLTPEQRKQGTAAAFYLIRGMFLDDRRWDARPDGRSY